MYFFASQKNTSGCIFLLRKKSRFMGIAGVLPKKQKGERAMKKRKRGFTIVELVIVIAVIA
ncbi:MAG: prepilin-type N-terminal cleavage/methylation domain-containing protein, partial [Firmicutes bacterium]|nr:prepilin-type N-terminal cleavage/methylation domain-containing protein [Bacillota bacterium]